MASGNCSEDFFRLPPLGKIVILLTWFLIHGTTVFISDNTLVSNIPLIGTLFKALNTHYPVFMLFLVYLAVIVHIVESIYTWKICRDRHFTTNASLKWTLSTFIFGFLSLTMLVKLHPFQEKNK